MAILGILAGFGCVRAQAQLDTFAGNAQHTSQYSAPAQHLDALRWTTPVDLVNSGALAHYGAPLITPSNTVIVPVRTSTNFLVRAFEGATGRLKYTLISDYALPSASWVPAYQPVIARPPSGARLYYAGPGGTIYYIEDLDSDTPVAPVQQCFYTNLAGYTSNANAFNSAVFLNTPLTADTNGVVFFGFRVQQSAPAPLNNTNSGYVRLDPAGNAVYVLAGTAAADSRITRDTHNCAPALSNDGATLYVAVKERSSISYCYLLGLDSATLATKYSALLRDPRSTNYASVTDDSTASPMIGPDGDVFYGVLSNPNNASRGFLLHFSADLQTRKLPSGFGWDYTAAIVPTNMVPGYSGTSTYLLFSKYNNYTGGDGDGINKIALLDPNAPQLDPHSSAAGLLEMREILTVNGCTPDSSSRSATYPLAVREWCINSAAVNPATKSVFAPSEDGRIYRWDLSANSLSEVFTLGPGVGSPYVPTVIAPDGAIYTLNGGKLFALHSFTNVGIAISSSSPDLRSVAVGQPVTFTASVTNPFTGDSAPTGTVTFLDFTYRGLTAFTNILAADVPLTNGLASVTTSALIAGGSYVTNCLGNHFITARYSGDGAFPAGSVTLLQKVHASASQTMLSSASGFGSSNAVTFTATVTSSPAGGGKPTGMVSFWDGSTFLAQVPLNTNSVAAFTTTNLNGNSHAISAIYSSDTVFASSSGSLIGFAPYLTDLNILSDGAFQLTFSNIRGAPFTVFGTTNIELSPNDWERLGPPIEVFPGQFQFTDSSATNNTQRFYRVLSP